MHLFCSSVVYSRIISSNTRKVEDIIKRTYGYACLQRGAHLHLSSDARTINVIMCSGPFRGVQGHDILRMRTERRGHMGWKRGEVAYRNISYYGSAVLLYYHSFPGAEGLEDQVAHVRKLTH